ncbi:hypothetical protein [Xanthomonas bundabergensis]|uniref:hypothetical protein n=1 Tax=Xanthomonas bundabergensis TaxID=3160842 RepID=UPI003519BC62
MKKSLWLVGQGDLVKTNSEAVLKESMDLGISLSPWDRREPEYADFMAYASTASRSGSNRPRTMAR